MLGLALAASSTPAAAGTRIPTVPPPALPPAEGPPPVGPSYIDLRLEIPLASVRAGLERALPVELRPSARVDTARADGLDYEPEHGEPGERGGEAEREWKGRPVRWRGLLRRSPIEVAARSDSLIVGSDLAWSVELLERGLEGARCGSVAAPGGGRIGAESLIGWSDDWTLESRSRARPTRFATRCRLDPPGLDFTHRLNAQLDSRLMSVLPGRVDSVLRAVTDQSGTIRAVLKRLARPMMIADSAAWFVWNVRAARVDPPRGAGEVILAHVVFEAQPELVPRPPAPAAPALPPPLVRLSGTGTRLPFDCWVDFEDIVRDIVSMSPEASDARPGELRVAAAHVRGAKDRLAIELELGGPLTGTAWLVGTLSVEPTRFLLSCPDLDWSPETRRALQRAGAARRGSVLGAELERVRDTVRRRLERPLEDCVSAWDKWIRDALQPDVEFPTIQAGISQREVGSVFCTDRAIGVRVIASGRAQVIAVPTGPARQP